MLVSLVVVNLRGVGPPAVEIIAEGTDQFLRLSSAGRAAWFYRPVESLPATRSRAGSGARTTSPAPVPSAVIATGTTPGGRLASLPLRHLCLETAAPMRSSGSMRGGATRVSGPISFSDSPPGSPFGHGCRFHRPSSSTPRVAPSFGRRSLSTATARRRRCPPRSTGPTGWSPPGWSMSPRPTARGFSASCRGWMPLIGRPRAWPPAP